MIQLLIDNPLLLLFIVGAIGYPLGRIKVRGTSIGVASVLFVGLAFGALHPELRLPTVVFEMGLVVFIYTVGLTSGPGFFASLRRKGIRDNLFVLGMLLLAFGITLAARQLLDLRSTIAAGLFAGSLTNTPALAGLLDFINTTAPPGLLDQLLAEPVVGYSVAYPMGVLGVILSIALTQRWWGVDYAWEATQLRQFAAATGDLHSWTIRVTHPEAVGEAIQTLRERFGWNIVFSRREHAGTLSLVTGATRLEESDLITAIGMLEDLERVVPYLGEPADKQLELDRSEYDFRRMFVSNQDVVGRRLKDLKLPQRFGAIVTRVRRGDIDLLAHGDIVLELGDRVRVVTHRQNMDDVSEFFGDSYRALSEIDLLTFSLGLVLGMLLGMVPVPLPGGVVFRLGFAGGPLIVALVLGAVGRTGRIVWSLPYSANLTLRQVGLVLLLAGIGTRAGYTFVSTFSQSGGFLIFLAGVAITCTTALTTLWIGYRLLKIRMSILTGMLAALHTQPAVLAFALEQTDNELPNIGYALVFPVATIAKIILAQLILALA